MFKTKAKWCNKCNHLTCRKVSIGQTYIFILLFFIGVIIGGIIYGLFVKGKKCYTCGLFYKKNYDKEIDKIERK